jgi:hypothetical protein
MQRLAGGWSRAVVLFWKFWQECGFSSREDVFTFNLIEKGTL